MPLTVDEQMAQANSRVSAVRLSMFTLRTMENWRVVVDDCEKALVLVAVTAISGERFARDEDFKDDLRDLRNVFPQELLRQCNVSSVAAATGFNRETTRRKINELIDAGILVRTARGRIGYSPGFAQMPSVAELIRK
jgi:hypothetical protein